MNPQNWALLSAILGFVSLAHGGPVVDDLEVQQRLANEARSLTFACQSSSISNVLVECQNGEWPSSFNPTIPPTAKMLYVKSLSLPPIISQLRPVPPLPQLVELHLSHVFTLQPDPNNASALRRFPFPLREFTRLLNRSQLRELEFFHVFLGNLTEELFTGFPALQTLSLKDCDISLIDPRSFSSLGSPVFRTLYVTHNPNLVVFPWDSLVAVSGSILIRRLLLKWKIKPYIQVIISDNERLEAIDFSPSFPSTAKMTLPKLMLASFKFNLALRSLPSRVVQTFPLKNDLGNEIKVEFGFNGNDCLDCHLVRSLIDWARRGPTDASKFSSTGWISMTLGCRNATTTFTSSVGEPSAKTGFWLNYSEPDACHSQTLSVASQAP